MNEQEMLEAMRTEAKERNENLKKQASDRLKKNAEYNKSNKRKDWLCKVTILLLASVIPHDSGYIADNATLYISADEAEASLETLRTFARADLDFKVMHLQVIGTVDTK